MTYEEALKLVTAALAPQSLSTLQIDVFQRAWNKQSYEKMARELNHEYSYIKDVGAELWKLLSQKLGIQVTKLNLQEAVTRYAQLEQIRKLPALPHNRVDWGEAPDTSQFCGRQAQLATLKQWVSQDRCRLVAIVGMGGIGKTMLVTQLAQQLALANQFEVVVWRSLLLAPPLVDLITELMSALAPEQSLPMRLDAMMRQLLEQLRHHRCLLILDNVEAVLSSSELVGTYRPGYEDYGWLLQQLGEGRHQSSILLTSREIPTEVVIPSGPTAAVRLLRLAGLSIEEGETILATKGLTFPAAQPQVQELIERYQGNPLALEIVATPLKELFDGNIAAFLAQETLLFKDIRSLLAQQFNRLYSLERQVMYWLAINREPVTAAQLQAEFTPSVSFVELRDALVSLDRRSLIETIKPTEAKPTTQCKLDCVGYTQQPMVMEYVTEQLVEQACFEVEYAQIVNLRSHTLLKAQAKDHVRDVQIRLIVQPLTARLLEVQCGSENLNNLLQLLRVQQLQVPLQPGYFAGNAIHLLCHLGADLSHLDFSNLMIWQADLRMVNLPGTNFSHADLSHSIFTQSMSDILCVAFSRDAKYITTSHDSREVCVWGVEDGQQTKQYLASGNEDGTVKLWDVSNSQYLFTLEGHTRQVQALAFDPADQLLASGSDDCSVKLWDLQTGQCLQTLQGHSCPVVSISFHPQGKLLVTGGFDSSLKLWDLQQGTNIRTMQGHTSPIRSVTFDPEGRMLVSSSEDGTIRLWDSYTGDCFRVLTVPRPDQGMNILGVTGLTDAQKETLRVLGAIES